MFFLKKIKDFITGLHFNFTKIVILWLLFITTILLFIEAERLAEIRLLILAYSNMLIGITALIKEFNAGDSVEDTHDTDASF